MSASAPLPAEGPRDRSIEARRAARIAKYERERLIVDSLNRGVTVAEIAERIGVTEKRMRARVKEILARRMPEAPEEFAALQASRLNEALMIAYGAMSPGNLKAVALVVRIVRALDRYHGFADPAAGRASPPVDAAAGRVSRAQRARLQAARPETRPETAPQTIEKTESEPENVAVAGAPEAPWPGIQRVRRARQDDIGPEPAAAPRFVEPAATPCAGAEMAAQTIENIDSAPDNSTNPAAASPVDAAAGRVGRAPHGVWQDARLSTGHGARRHGPAGERLSGGLPIGGFRL